MPDFCISTSEMNASPVVSMADHAFEIGELVAHYSHSGLFRYVGRVDNIHSHVRATNGNLMYVMREDLSRPALLPNDTVRHRTYRPGELGTYLGMAGDGSAQVQYNDGVKFMVLSNLRLVDRPEGSANMIRRGTFVKYRGETWYVHGHPSRDGTVCINPVGHSCVIDLAGAEPVTGFDYRRGDPVRYTPAFCKFRRSISDLTCRELRGTVINMVSEGARVAVKWRHMDRTDIVLAHYIEVVPKHTPRPRNEIDFLTVGGGQLSGRLVTLLLDGHKIKFVIVRGTYGRLLYHWASGARIGFCMDVKHGDSRLAPNTAAQIYINNHCVLRGISKDYFIRSLSNRPVINEEAGT